MQRLRCNFLVVASPSGMLHATCFHMEMLDGKIVHPLSYALDVSFNRHKNVYFGIWCCFALFVVADISCSIRQLLLWNKYYAHCSTDPTKHAGERRGDAEAHFRPCGSHVVNIRHVPHMYRNSLYTVYRLYMQCMNNAWKESCMCASSLTAHILREYSVFVRHLATGTCNCTREQGDRSNAADKMAATASVYAGRH